MDIKKCPFCGGKSRVHKYLTKWYARCNKCNSYSAPYDTPEAAADAWNTRSCIEAETKNIDEKRDCGYWVVIDYMTDYVNSDEYPIQWECSKCEYETGCINAFNYCPNCGSKNKDGDSE